MSKFKIKLGLKLEKFILWPALTSLFLLVILPKTYNIDISFGIMMSVAFLVHTLIFILMFSFGRKRLKNEILDLSAQISDIQRDHLMHFDLPHCLIDLNGRIIWYNDAFFDLLSDPKLSGKNIQSYFEGIQEEDFPTYEQPVKKVIRFEDKKIKVIMHQHILDNKKSSLVTDLKDLSYYSLYFYDVTTQEELKRINYEQKGVVAYIYIDNFEEVLQSIVDERRPILIAMIDKNLNALAKKTNGVLSKIEKDKYILFLQRKYLDQLKEDKFSVLDDIRGISIGNELPVTISLGVGVHEDNYDNLEEYATTAIDLALGRGGDQAVIKENDKFLFYGGKTRGVETNTRVKARIKSYAFREILSESDNIIVMGHHFQDLDSLGAAIGISACARLLGKKVNIVLEDITTSIKALYDRVQESEHFAEDIFVSGSKAVELCHSNTAVVVVDVNRPSYVEYPELLRYAKKVVVFDHHRVSSEYIDPCVLSYIEPYASSASEMVTEILRYITDKVKLDPTEADALFAGISVDTKNFVIKTGVKTFEAAAFLRRNGADVIRVRRFFKNDMETYKAKASAVRDAMIYKEHFAISKSPSNIINPTLAAAQAADELLNISGIRASFVMTDVNGTIFISARSFDNVNVQLIMEKLGGGGHLSVAGAQIQGVDLDEAIRQLIVKIDEYIEEGDEE